MRLSLLYLLVIGFFLPGHVVAALIVDSPLNFGRIAITNNSVVSSLQMTRNGQTTATNNIYVLEIGTPGVYTVTELPPYSLLTLTADTPAFSGSTIPGTEQFTLTAVDIPASVPVNVSGTAQFSVGGVLETSGNGGSYIGPATYEITVNINLTY
ncbi:DUF4402 domain-containing protein [Alteromonas facilis]|uniref:DUF4402 domain-containing protein n=1 Tax=Alteromonas facilis TaxID=2048004 RepID=UPI0013D8E81F|nr:DUF4402 domain-containing protein [Alteromonas facilis]